ncbi:MAG: serine hydrolase, partial [Acidobacteria bacterium]|nr:serine hydrolase [Acidobacteriota bacterium]
MNSIKSLIFFLVTLTIACTGDITFTGSGQSTAEKQFAPTPTPTIAPLIEKRDVELEAEIQEIALDAQGMVGVGAVLLETGESAWLNKDGKFPSQSVYKLPIAMAAMKLIDDRKARLDQEIAITPDDFVRWGYHSP